MISKHTGALSALSLPLGGRLLVGHVDEAGQHDSRVPIPAREYSYGDFWADARCHHCPARSEIGQLGAGALTLVVHRDGCPGLAMIRAELDDASPYPDRVMDTSDIDPDTGEEFGVGEQL